MIVDTSALVAILPDEIDAGLCAQAIEEADTRRISASARVADIRRSSTSAIVLRMRSQKLRAKRCFSKAMISLAPM